MEIGHFIRSRPKTSALALLIPLIAALVAAVVLMGQPERQTATATVSVPGSAANSASRVGLFVADFSEIATSGAVLGDVSEATGVDRLELEENLEVARIGQSSLFTVVYTGDEADTVEPVVREVISGSFSRLVQVGTTDEDLESATRAYDEAVAARSAYQDEIGTLQPESDYTDLSSRIRSLQITPEIGSTATIARLSAQREALVPQIRRMQELDQAVSDAAQRRDEAQQASESAQEDATESQSDSTITDLVVEPEARVGRIVQGVGVAAVAGLLVGIALLVLPDLLRRRRVTPADRPTDRPRTDRAQQSAPGETVTGQRLSEEKVPEASRL